MTNVYLLLLLSSQVYGLCVSMVRPSCYSARLFLSLRVGSASWLCARALASTNYLFVAIGVKLFPICRVREVELLA